MEHIVLLISFNDIQINYNIGVDEL